MKKITKILSVLLMLAVVAVTFAACGGNDGSVKGKTFELDKSATDLGDNEQVELVLSMFQEFSIKFNNDNTCKVKMTASLLGESQTEEADATYEQDGNKVTIKNSSSNETMDCTIEGGKLVMEQEGVKLVFSPK